MHKVYKHTQLESLVSLDYITELATNHLESGRFEEAATLIMKFKLTERFDMIEIAVGLVETKKSARFVLDELPAIRGQVIRKLVKPQTAKNAADLVKHY